MNFKYLWVRALTNTHIVKFLSVAYTLLRRKQNKESLARFIYREKSQRIKHGITKDFIK